MIFLFQTSAAPFPVITMVTVKCQAAVIFVPVLIDSTVLGVK